MHLTGSVPRWYDYAQFAGDNDVSTTVTEALVSGQRRPLLHVGS